MQTSGFHRDTSKTITRIPSKTIILLVDIEKNISALSKSKLLSSRSIKSQLNFLIVWPITRPSNDWIKIVKRAKFARVLRTFSKLRHSSLWVSVGRRRCIKIMPLRHIFLHLCFNFVQAIEFNTSFKKIETAEWFFNKKIQKFWKLYY